MAYRIKTQNAIVANTTIYVVTLLSPFFSWFINQFVINSFFIATTFGLLAHSANHYYYQLNRTRGSMIAGLLLFTIYMYTPFMGHHFSLARIMQLLPMTVILCLSGGILREVYNKVWWFFVVVSFFSLIVFFLGLLGLNLPYIPISAAHRSYVMDYYRLYGIVVELFRGDIPISGTQISRICGPFAEPGHFGIYLGFVLLAENLNLKKRGNVFMLIAGIFTFSPAFYFLLIIAIIKEWFSVKLRLNYSKALTALLIGFFVYFLLSDHSLAEQFRFLAFERSFGDIERSVLDDRVGEHFLIAYSTFKSSDSFLTGVGRHEALQINTPSNYRTFIYTYGLLGLGFLGLFIVTILQKLKKRDFVLFFIAILGVFAHRFWMFVSVPIVGLLFVLIVTHAYSYQNKHNSLR